MKCDGELEAVVESALRTSVKAAIEISATRTATLTALGTIEASLLSPTLPLAVALGEDVCELLRCQHCLEFVVVLLVHSQTLKLAGNLRLLATEILLNLSGGLFVSQFLLPAVIPPFPIAVEALTVLLHQSQEVVLVSPVKGNEAIPDTVLQFKFLGKPVGLSLYHLCTPCLKLFYRRTLGKSGTKK